MKVELGWRKILEDVSLETKFLFAFLFLVSSLAAIGVGVFYITRKGQAPSRSKAVGEGVSLYFAPSSLTLSKNSDFTLTVRINPDGKSVTGVELHIDFDKDRLELSSIQPTNSFPSVLLNPQIINSQGKASVVVAIGVSSPLPIPVTNTSDVVTVKGKSKGMTGVSTIKIGTDSKVAALGSDSNVLGVYGNATITVATPTPTPTKTPTPTPAKIGDVNGDGCVDIVDIGIVVDFYGEEVTASGVNKKADVNGDGTIDIIDIGIIIDRYEYNCQTSS